MVDDDAGVRRVIREILRRNGYAIEEAQDGAEALLHIGKTRFDLVTMDLMMARMDGVDAISVLVNESQTPILVISAHLTEQNREELTSRGIKHLLEKPFTTDQLLEAVGKLAPS